MNALLNGRDSEKEITKKKVLKPTPMNGNDIVDMSGEISSDEP